MEMSAALSSASPDIPTPKPEEVESPVAEGFGKSLLRINCLQLVISNSRLSCPPPALAMRRGGLSDSAAA